MVKSRFGRSAINLRYSVWFPAGLSIFENEPLRTSRKLTFCSRLHRRMMLHSDSHTGGCADDRLPPLFPGPLQWSHRAPPRVPGRQRAASVVDRIRLEHGAADGALAWEPQAEALGRGGHRS